jgi:hypothetical protein
MVGVRAEDAGADHELARILGERREIVRITAAVAPQRAASKPFDSCT